MYLPEQDGHQVYYFESGNPQGKPCVCIHGGPGSSSHPRQVAWLAELGYRVIQFDQRGCGHSLPAGWIEHNQTVNLVEDIERLRQHLQLEQWWVFGGSWGATLALEYAKHYPQHVLGMVLRGTFLARRNDWLWFSSPAGVAQQSSEAYQALCQMLNCAVGDTLAPVLHQAIFAEPERAYQAALAWDTWEAGLMKVSPPQIEHDTEQRQQRILRKQIYAHYALAEFFLPEHGVLYDLESLHDMPVVAVHGQRDQVCRFSSVEDLAEHVPQLQVIAVDAGHGGFEAEIQAGLVQAFSILSA